MQVLVHNAITSKGIVVSNRVFTLLESHKTDPVKKEMFIIVDGRGHDDMRQGNARLYIKSVSDYTIDSDAIVDTNVDNIEVVDTPVEFTVSTVNDDMSALQMYVKVHAATTSKGYEITDRVFKLIGQPKKDTTGLFIVVDGRGHHDLRQGKTRLYINSVADYSPFDKTDAETILNSSAGPASEQRVERTDFEISAEIKETFNILEEMTKAVATNVVKGLVVSGPAGIGKSHTVETTLVKNLGVLQLLRNGEAQYESISGGMSAAVLYQKLWEYKEEGQVLIFDDCDSILYDEDSLNILKAALDSKKTRRISWNTRSLHLQKNDIPNSFEYKGGIIFITNVDFKNVKSPRIANHLEAIVSRCHYMDIGINTAREKIIHMRNVLESNDMLKEYEFMHGEEKEVIKYIEDNATKLREISLRTVLKVADLRRAVPDKWEQFANRNVLKV